MYLFYLDASDTKINKIASFSRSGSQNRKTDAQTDDCCIAGDLGVWGYLGCPGSVEMWLAAHLAYSSSLALECANRAPGILLKGRF